MNGQAFQQRKLLIQIKWWELVTLILKAYLEGLRIGTWVYFVKHGLCSTIAVADEKLMNVKMTDIVNLFTLLAIIGKIINIIKIANILLKSVSSRHSQYHFMIFEELFILRLNQLCEQKHINLIIIIEYKRYFITHFIHILPQYHFQ